MPPIDLLVIGSSCVCLFMAMLWFIQRIRGEADIVDFGWTVSLGFLAILYSILGLGDVACRSLVGIFGLIWASRLGLHLWKRVREPGEDGRYVTLRQSWGNKAQFNFFIFFQVQALSTVFLSLSFLVPACDSRSTSPILILFAILWFTTVIAGEALADKQLHVWRRNAENQGKTCRAGLWKYSRHPNYFFEWLYWISYSFLAMTSSYWPLTLISPAIILFLILKVTGIPPTEQRALQTRGDDYRDYQKTTSAFVPWFKRQREA